MEGGNGSNSVQQQMVGAVAQQQLQVMAVSEAMGAAVGVQGKLNNVGGGGGEIDSVPKRKRGRPRKEKTVEVRALAESSAAAAATATETPQKRGRGRPKGSGKWQSLMTSLSGNALESAGSNFTPHTMTIQAGENIVQRISSFTQKAYESVCVLSASGPISSAEILRPASFGGVVRYEGQFEIVSLTGSYANNGTATSGGNGKNCLLTVQLANPDGSLFGGAVGSSLIVGGPTQLVIATFRQNREKEKEKVKVKVKIQMPNKLAATTPLQIMANGQTSAAEPSSLQRTGSHVSPNSIDAVEKFISGHDNHPSHQPFNWTSLQSSAPMSQRAMSDFNTGVH